MKKIFLIIALFLFSTVAISQVPQLFKYQGLARGSDGNPVSNTTISLRISIHQANPTGTVVYKETHSPLTSEFGSFSVNIGAGTVVTGNFSTIAWGRNTYFQEVEMDVTGGTSFVSMGTSQYLSVPYALAADSAIHVLSPLFLQNNNSGDSAVAIFAANVSNNAPAIYATNSGNGTALIAESQNGKAIQAESGGNQATFSVKNTGTGNAAEFDGAIQVNGDLFMSPGTLTSNNVSVNNNVTLGGTLNAPIIMANQGNFSVGLTTAGETVNGNLNVNGNINVTGAYGPITTNLVTGTQANFSVSVTTNSLTVNGSGHVFGSLQVDGNLSKGSGSFKIDHPVDPANKFLYHSFVESPDMKNIYDGNVATDANGEAEVELPSYFEALNRDFRYQLTVIGQFAQVIVAQEISNNKFKIKTDKPHVKISWQVTGIRKDAFAEKNRIIPETDKNGDEKGKYLYPAAFNLGEEMKIGRNKNFDYENSIIIYRTQHFNFKAECSKYCNGSNFFRG